MSPQAASARSHAAAAERAPSLAIRPARPGERHWLEQLQWRASLANPGDRAALLAHPDAIELARDCIDSGQVHVAIGEERKLGFAVVLPREDGDAELDGLFVEPWRWRGGVGRALVEHAAGHARALGAGALHVVANPQALEFYLRVGFVAAGEVATRFGPGIAMLRQL